MGYRTNLKMLCLYTLAFVFALSNAVTAKTVINVSKHIVKGSGVTQKQMEDQFKKYKAVWDSPEVEHKQIGKVNEVNNVDEGRVAGAINMYGTSLVVPPPGNAGICHNRRYIEVGPACPNDTGAHEGGHWGGAYPDDANSEHGTPVGRYPGDPNYMGYDTNGDGKSDANDSNNVMFPGRGRTGDNVDPNQRKRYNENMKKWAESQKAIKAERGKELKDAKADGPPPYDISECVVWGLGENEMDYMLYFEILMEPILQPPAKVGFYLETDQSCITGESPEGLDYFIGYDTASEEIVFQRYDAAVPGGWAYLPPEMVQVSIEYMQYDAPFLPIPIGVTFSVPLSVFVPPSQNGLLAYRAVSLDPAGSLMDTLPDAGLAVIITSPMPPAGITGDLDGDSDVDFEDFAYLAENWLIGT